MPAGIRIGIIAREESSEAWRIAHERYPVDRQGRLRMPLRGESQTLHGTGSYQNLATDLLTAVLLIGLYHLRTIRPSVHIWLVATTRCAGRSQNISEKTFGRLFLMCHRVGKNCIIQPLCLTAPLALSFQRGVWADRRS